MVKNAPDPNSPITEQELNEYAEKYTHFSLEMNVAKQLSQLGFKTFHSGTYEDPVTKKRREFDIRAIKLKNECYLHLSVECKNISASSPILVQSVQRNETEAFHDILEIKGTDSINILTMRGKDSFYSSKPDSWVSKSVDQIARKGINISGNDEKTFEKISQAIHSSAEVICDATPGEDILGRRYLFLPILVIPDETLWEIIYDIDGTILSKVKKIKSASHFLHSSWINKFSGTQYTFSHLEIVTFSEISNFLKKIKSSHFGFK